MSSMFEDSVEETNTYLILALGYKNSEEYDWMAIHGELVLQILITFSCRLPRIFSQSPATVDLLYIWEYIVSNSHGNHTAEVG